MTTAMEVTPSHYRYKYNKVGRRFVVDSFPIVVAKT